MPTAKASPASEMTLIDRPSQAMATKVPITETGMAANTMMVGRMLRRNSIRTPSARQPPTKMFCCTRSMAEAMYFVSS